MGETGGLQALFKCKAWANEACLVAMGRLGESAPAAAMEIAIRILDHSFIVDRIFAATMQRTSHGYASVNAAVAPTLDELADAIRASDQWYVDYVQGLGPDLLDEAIDFTFTDGAPGRMSREEMLMHVLTHGGYHRGQLALIMMQNGVDPGEDGLTTFLHMAEPAARRRLGAANGPSVAHAGATAAATSVAMTRLEALTSRMRAAVGADLSLGKTLKFDLKGEGFVFVDGTSVSNDDRAADLTLTVGIDDLAAIAKGKLAPMTAMMSGRLGLSDMGIAMGLQGKMKALFARMA